MNKVLISLGLRYLATRLDGKKTYIGGAVMILIGLVKIITAAVGAVGNVTPDVGAEPMDIDLITTTMETGVGMIGAGLAALGLGHKIQKSGETP
jgi:hypothetical protein